MYFYRIEDEHGKGMYRNCAKQNELGLKMAIGTFAARLCTNVWGHTPPDCEFPDHFDIFQKRCNKEYYFGFKSLSQVYKWFDTVEAILFLQKTGFKISKYSIERKYIETSDSQCIYHKGKETFLEHIDFEINNLARKCDYSDFENEEKSLIYKMAL